jgi:hypothetical protein
MARDAVMTTGICTFESTSQIGVTLEASKLLAVGNRKRVGVRGLGSINGPGKEGSLCDMFLWTCVQYTPTTHPHTPKKLFCRTFFLGVNLVLIILVLLNILCKTNYKLTDNLCEMKEVIWTPVSRCVKSGRHNART